MRWPHSTGRSAAASRLGLAGPDGDPAADQHDTVGPLQLGSGLRKKRRRPGQASAWPLRLILIADPRRDRGQRAAGRGHRARRTARVAVSELGMDGEHPLVLSPAWSTDRLRRATSAPGHRVRDQPATSRPGSEDQGRVTRMRLDWREMKAVVAALAANLGIAIAEFIAFLLAGSASMLAGAGALGPPRYRQRGAAAGRPRPVQPAAGKTSPVRLRPPSGLSTASWCGSSSTVGAAFSIYEQHPQDHHAAADPRRADRVHRARRVLMEVSLRTRHPPRANQVRGGRAEAHPADQVAGAARGPARGHSRAAARRVRRGGAFRGHRQQPWDAWAHWAFGVLLATAAAILAMEMKSLLIGEAASSDVQRRIVAALEDSPRLRRIIHLRTVHIGPDSRAGPPPSAASAESDSAKQAHRGHQRRRGAGARRRPIAKIYLEPDIYRPARPSERGSSDAPPNNSGPEIPATPRESLPRHTPGVPAPPPRTPETHLSPPPPPPPRKGRAGPAR